LLLWPEVLVEEFGEFSDVEEHGDPAVLSTGMDHEFDVVAGLAGAGFIDEISSWLLRGYLGFEPSRYQGSRESGASI